MKKKIGVMGSGGGSPEEIRKKAFEIGREIAKNNCILVTGATCGLPYESAKGAKKEGGMVIGVSPAMNLKEHKKVYNLPYDYTDALIFVGSGLKGRNVINIRSCDGVIFVSGGTGTLNEFTIAYDEEKVIGILEGSGGMTNLIKDIVKLCGPLSRKSKNTKILYDSDPKKLVKKVLGELE